MEIYIIYKYESECVFVNEEGASEFAPVAVVKIEVVVAAVTAPEFLFSHRGLRRQSGINLSGPQYQNEASSLVLKRGLF